MTDQELKSKLQAKLTEIADILCETIDKCETSGGVGGISGFLSRYYKSEIAKDKYNS